MKVYCGMDLVDIGRIEKIIARQGESFINRCFTAGEARYADSKRSESVRISSYAARFAAKEACGKAFGTGILSRGIALKDIEVVISSSGTPALRLTGNAKKMAEELNITDCSVSLTHDGGVAGAVVVMLGGDV
ncbi:MAG: holo-ACP synthase [Mageeibacillus sp.]|jgi:holo-[acyl-carrier protein] synthase|nr:holo-ACP synthase [Mageeibacillus sp.]MCI1263924.1 holo-ACP synthase [Saccharofermentans sp.]MCI1768865.1 holo-ACP synthase [Mageeibacillus sp.]